MVCDDCEAKTTKSSQMEMWKEGHRSAKITEHGGGGSRHGGNKLLTGNRYGNMSGGANRFQPYKGGGASKRCRLCKGMLHGDADLYCQHCAYKHGLCSMCGKQIADTSMHASGQMWDGTEEQIKKQIEAVEEEVKEEKRRAKHKGLVAAGLLGGPGNSFPRADAAGGGGGGGGADGDAAEAADAAAAPEQQQIFATFGKEGGLGIVFTDEGWEIESIAEGTPASEMESIHPGLCLTEIQGVDIVKKSDEEVRALFGEAGRPVKLTFVRDNPRYARRAAEPPAEAEAQPQGGGASDSAGGAAAGKAPPPPPRGKGKGKKQEAAAEPAAAGGPGEGFVYNWKTGLHHNASTGYSYDQQTGYYIYWNKEAEQYNYFDKEKQAWVRRMPFPHTHLAGWH